MNDRDVPRRGQGWRGADWQNRRRERLRRFVVIRVGLWLVLVAVVVGLNLLVGGRFWGIGFIVVSGGFLLFRLASIWFMSSRFRRNPGAMRARYPGGRGADDWSGDSDAGSP